VSYVLKVLDDTMPDAAKVTWGRKVYHWALSCILGMLDKYKDGFNLMLYNGEVKWLVPFLAMGLTDWPEGELVCSCDSFGH
jgi:hypothetical protein